MARDWCREITEEAKIGKREYARSRYHRYEKND